MPGVPAHMTIALDVVEMYFQTAVSAIEQAQQLEELVRHRDGRLEGVQISESYDWGDEIDPDDDAWAEAEEAEQQVVEAVGLLAQSLAVAQVMCALALEAHINGAARKCLSGRSLDEFDKLSAAGKWLFLPRLLGVGEFDSTAQPFQGFSELVKRRNRIVHAKSMEMMTVLSSSPDPNAFLTDGLNLGRQTLATTRAMVVALSSMLGVNAPVWAMLSGSARFYSVVLEED